MKFCMDVQKTPRTPVTEMQYKHNRSSKKKGYRTVRHDTLSPSPPTLSPPTPQLQILCTVLATVPCTIQYNTYNTTKRNNPTSETPTPSTPFLSPSFLFRLVLFCSSSTKPPPRPRG